LLDISVVSVVSVVSVGSVVSFSWFDAYRVHGIHHQTEIDLLLRLQLQALRTVLRLERGRAQRGEVDGRLAAVGQGSMRTGYTLWLMSLPPWAGIGVFMECASTKFPAKSNDLSEKFSKVRI